MFDIMPLAVQQAVEGEMEPVWVNLITRQLFSRLDIPDGSPVACFYTGNFVLNPKVHEVAREVSGWVGRQRGRAGKFRMYDPVRVAPAYDLDVTPTQQPWSDSTYFTDGTGFVDGFLPPRVAIDEPARAGATSIVVRGYPVSTAGVARMGDRIEIQRNGIPEGFSQYYQIDRNGRSNSDGKIRIYITPGLRAPVAPGDSVVLRFPRALMRFATDEEGRMRFDRTRIGRTGFSVVEVLPE